MVQKQTFYKHSEDAEQSAKDKETASKSAANDNFWITLEKSEDPFDNLEGLAQHIHNNTGSTGVYIGQLEPPLLKIKDDADEDAHLDKHSPEVIKFKFANSDHKELTAGTIL